MFPILFELGPVSVQSLWLMIALGLVVSAWVLVKLSQKSRLKIDFMSYNGLEILAGTLIGGRLLFIILNPGLFFSNISLTNILSLFAIWDKGISFWGALIGFTITFIFIARQEDENILGWLDILTISTLVFVLFGHLGAFLDGINYGRETNMPWGITFESGTVKYVVPIHPTQLYALIYSGLLAFILYEIYKNWKVKKDGLVAEIGITSYLILRFLEEFFRGDEAIEVFGIRLRFIVFFLLAAASGTWLYKQYGKHRSKVEDMLETAKDTIQKTAQFIKK
jgi:phosphatidylglycerol---prolipoprotein diacylglyceryl transferase